ncbi:hypothetical protein AVEN_186177-1 [Araneus ventricosus]|uniref:Uncharacterized protein n=1 Tax=Araneus ventricosus TaxID=182803 RepID=A0A4Y2GH66_ARAVE|nr:hypothetical protein AVEN_186177-1 [Araneus ventricosus]
MVLPIKHTKNKKKRRGYKKHDMKYFSCLCSNDGDGKMEFQGFSESYEVVQSTDRKKRLVSLLAEWSETQERAKENQRKTLQ